MNEVITQPTVASTNGAANFSLMMLEPDRLRAVESFATMMSKGTVTVPKHLQGKPSDCLAITLQSMRWGMDPFVVAQKTHIVNGNLGYEAQLIIAVLQNSGAVRGRPHFEYRGDSNALECRAAFIPTGEAELVWTEWLCISQIKVKNSPLWTTNPKQQMGYVQARNWARLYAPGALLGVYTTDELETVNPETGEVTGRRGIPASAGVVERVDGGDQTAARPQLETWPEAAFAAQLPRWTKAVEAGLKTAADIEALAASKGALTAEQLTAIRALKPAPAEPPAAAPVDDPFVTDMEAAEEGQP